MQSAELERTTVDIEAKAGARTIDLRATGQVVKFDGFLTLYQESTDETSEDENALLEFLATRDATCPLCHYNLRALRSARTGRAGSRQSPFSGHQCTGCGDRSCRQLA